MTLCRKCGKEIPDGEEICQECQQLENQSSDQYLEELMKDMERELNGQLKEEPVAEEEPVLEEEPVSEKETTEEDIENIDDVNELLELLSKDDYDEEALAEEEPVETEEQLPELDETPIETSLFSDDDDSNIFADEIESLSIEDIFDGALSAVEYSEAEEEPQVIEEFASPKEIENSNTEETFDSLMLDDSFVLNENEIPVLDTTSEKADKKSSQGKESIWKRVFGNIITEQTAEEEAKERELEQATAEERAAAKEEKKKQQAAEKAEKAQQAKAEKERKAAEKAEQAAVKSAEKEEKKRLKAEAAANEVVGKINPLGASIVMLFFGLLCVATIVGSQIFSHYSSVNGAESSFDERDYKNAYKSLAGVKVEEDSDIFETKDKIRICMQLQRQLDAYGNYYKLKMYLEALDSLMKGIRSYDENQSKAERYSIVSQYNELEVKIAEQLYNEFGVSETQARSINSIEGQEEYTNRLEMIIAQWEKRNKEDEK